MAIRLICRSIFINHYYTITYTAQLAEIPSKTIKTKKCQDIYQSLQSHLEFWLVSWKIERRQHKGTSVKSNVLLISRRESPQRPTCRLGSNTTLSWLRIFKFSYRNLKWWVVVVFVVTALFRTNTANINIYVLPPFSNCSYI